MKWLLITGLYCLPMAAEATPAPAPVTYEEQAVAAVLMGEAWSDGTRGMEAVADVIHQRAVEKQRAPIDVIAAHRGRVHTFSCLNGTSIDKLIVKYSHEPAYQKALRLAELTCEAPQRLPNLVGPANHYTRSTEKPYWARGQRPVAIVGQHAFYYLAQY